VKWSGLDQLLKGNKLVSREAVLDLLNKNERWIMSKPQGANSRWFIDIMAHDKSTLSRIGADQTFEEMEDGALKYGLKLASQTADLDEWSKQRLLRWASDNGYETVEFMDGTIEKVVARNVGMMKGAYGVTDFVAGEMDKMQAVIRGFTNANPITAVEELYHAISPYLPAADRKVLDNWSGPIAEKMMKANPNSNWDKKHWMDEIEARGFQKYFISTSRAPKAIQVIFDKMRNTCHLL